MTMIGVLSDAHGNQPAFELTITLLKKFGASQFVFLGDALGYLPTTAVLNSIEELKNNVVCVRGNHEDMLLSGQYNSAHEPSYQHQKTRHLMDNSQMELIKNWPTTASLNYKAGKALFIHGSPHDPTYGYVYPETDLAAFSVKERFVFMGNTHRPFVRMHGDATFINVGSCGLPRDHGALGPAVLFNEQTGIVRIIRFDIRKSTQRALAMVGLVHPSVIKLFERQTQHYEGELIGN